MWTFRDRFNLQKMRRNLSELTIPPVVVGGKKLSRPQEFQLQDYNPVITIFKK